MRTQLLSGRVLRSPFICAPVLAVALLSARQSAGAIFGRESIQGAEQAMDKIEHLDLIRTDVTGFMTVR